VSIGREPYVRVMDKATRSRIMRSIRKKNTKPELIVRRMVHALGFRFRLHRRDLPGSPDLVLPRYRKVIFVHGCFWHQHPGCRSAKQPRSRIEYWGPKLARNVARDARALEDIAALGWKSLVLWECELRDEDTLRSKLLDFLRPPEREQQREPPCQSLDEPHGRHGTGGTPSEPVRVSSGEEGEPAQSPS
jgi:DNA mismatch endonuclease, patch repair protein